MVVTQTEARTDLRGLAQDITWLDAVLSDAVALQRARAGETLPGVYISEGEVDELLGRPPLVSTTEDGVVAPPEAWYGERLVQLALRCGLTAFDAAVLLIVAGAAARPPLRPALRLPAGRPHQALRHAGTHAGPALPRLPRARRSGAPACSRTRRCLPSACCSSAAMTPRPCASGRCKWKSASSDSCSARTRPTRLARRKAAQLAGTSAHSHAAEPRSLQRPQG